MITATRFSQDNSRRVRLDEIGTRLTGEEIINILIFSYLAFGGNLHVPYFQGSQSAINKIFAACFWVTSILTFVRNHARIHWELWTCRFAFIFLVYVSASIFWGANALYITIVPTITGICTFLYFNYLLDRYSTYDLTRMLVWIGGVLLTLSILVIIFIPSYALDNGIEDPNNSGAWQGVFNQKNQLGMMTAISFAVALGLKPKSTADHIWKWLLICVSLICAVGSQSREAWVAMSLSVLISLFIQVLAVFEPKSRLPIVISGSALLITASATAYFYTDRILAFFGRTATLSGRTSIWNDCLLLIQRRPWFGYGTFGVWGTGRAWDVVVRENWLVTSSHNTYIEIILLYGIIGFCLYLPIILISFVFLFRGLLSYDISEIRVLFFVMVSLFLLSFVAPLIVYSPSIGMVLILYCTSHLEQVEHSGFMRLRN